MKNWIVVALFLFAVTASNANAATFTIDDSSHEGAIILTCSGFEAGFGVNGPPFTPLPCGVAPFPAFTTAFPETSAASGFNFSAGWLPPAGSSFDFSDTIYFVEGANPSLVSDIFSYHTFTQNVVGQTQAFIEGSFVSEVADELGLVPSGVHVFVENGSSFTFAAPNLDGSVTSDANVVPEPATLMLLTTGLIPLLARRKKRTDA